MHRSLRNVKKKSSTPLGSFQLERIKFEFKNEFHSCGLYKYSPLDCSHMGVRDAIRVSVRNYFESISTLLFIYVHPLGLK